MIYKPDSKLIGFTGLKIEPEIDEVDIGYRLHPEYWGRGIATQSSIEILAYGFSKLNLNRIVGLAMKENPASTHILKKIGLKHYHEGPWSGESVLLDWYELEKSDWKKTHTYIATDSKIT